MNLDLALNAGYYVYNNRIYVQKDDLYEAIAQARDPRPQTRYWFHDNVYSQYDWKTEPSETLTELFAERARQLRQKYDYLILMFSGGADSTQVLDTFLLNNIFIDEVRSYYPTTLIDSLNLTADSGHPLGLLSEYSYAAKPRLTELRNVSPKTKIVVADMTDFLVKGLGNDNEMDKNASSNLSAPSYHTLRMHYQTDDIEAYVDDSHKQKVCVIYGADKPSLVLIEGELLFSFYDQGCSVPGMDCRTNSNIARELFYWSKDAPKIPIKQSHAVKAIYQTQPGLYRLASKHVRIFNQQMKETDFFKGLFYPNFKPMFQKKVKNFDDAILVALGGNKAKDAIAERDRWVEQKLHGLQNTITTPQGRNIITSRFYSLGKIYD